MVIKEFSGCGFKYHLRVYISIGCSSRAAVFPPCMCSKGYVLSLCTVCVFTA